MTKIVVRVLAAILAASALAGRGETGDTVANQDAAREMSVQLVESVLDQQLLRLQENRLQHLPMFSEIAALRATVEQLAGGEMRLIAQKLRQAAAAGRNLTPKEIDETRDLARRVVVQLVAERQRIRRRLQVAGADSLAENLIEMQESVHQQTQDAIDMADRNGPDVLAGLRHDQGDVRSLLGQLEAAVREIAEWGGALGESATEALQQLRPEEVEMAAARAESRLRSGRLRDAVIEQQKVLEVLHSVHKALQPAQGLSSLNRAAALRLTRQLLRQQLQLREETEVEPLGEHNMVTRQRAIGREAGQLQSLVRVEAAADDLAGKARDAAAAAEQSLLAGDRAATLKAQEEVIEALLSVAQVLSGEGATQTEAASLSSEMLRRIGEGVGRAIELQAQASELATEDPRGAAAKEGGVIRELTTSRKLSPLPKNLEELFDAAQESVEAARESLQSELDLNARRASTSSAERALSELAEEISSSLAQGSSDDQANGESSASNQSRNNSSSTSKQSQQSSQASADEAGSGQDYSAGSQDENSQLDSRGQDSDEDAAPNAKRFDRGPWFAKLPPELRRALETRRRNAPPAEFEELLRRYFKE